MVVDITQIPVKEKELANFFVWLTGKNVLIEDKKFKPVSKKEFVKTIKQYKKENKFDLLKKTIELNHVGNQFIGLTAYSKRFTPQELHNLLLEVYGEINQKTKLLSKKTNKEALKILDTNFKNAKNYAITKKIIKEHNKEKQKKETKTNNDKTKSDLKFLKSLKKINIERLKKRFGKEKRFGVFEMDLFDSELEKILSLVRVIYEIELKKYGFREEFIKEVISQSIQQKLARFEESDFLNKLKLDSIKNGYLFFPDVIDELIMLEDPDITIEIKPCLKDLSKLFYTNTVLLFPFSNKDETNFFSKKTGYDLYDKNNPFKSEADAENFLLKLLQYKKTITFQMHLHAISYDLNINQNAERFKSIRFKLGEKKVSHQVRELSNYLKSIIKPVPYSKQELEKELDKIIDKNPEKLNSEETLTLINALELSEKQETYYKKCEELSKTLVTRINQEINKSKVITFTVPIVTKNLIRLKTKGEKKKWITSNQKQ